MFSYRLVRQIFLGVVLISIGVGSGFGLRGELMAPLHARDIVRYANELRPAARVLLATDKTIVGEPILYPQEAPARITAAVVEFAPGASTGWHMHDVPTFGYMLEGELTVDYGAHGKRIYRAGDALVEAMSIAHTGHNSGQQPAKILAVFVGAEGKKNSVPAKP